MVSFVEPNWECDDNQYPLPRDRDTPWQTRAWTFQEKALSPRCLVFGSERLSWECMEASYREETEFEWLPNGTFPALPSTESIFSSKTVRQPPEELLDYCSDFHNLFAKLMTQYNYRIMSFDSDALRAFEGVLNTLRLSTKIEFLWGLPLSLFEQGLLWYVSGRRTQRRKLRRVPTWSWLHYRYSTAAEEDITLRSLAAVRCFHRCDLSPLLRT